MFGLMIGARYVEVNSGKQKIVGEKIGTITIDVYKAPFMQSPFYYMEPDKKELLPVVDVLDDVLTCHSIHL